MVRGTYKRIILKTNERLTSKVLKELKNDLDCPLIDHSQVNNTFRYFLPVTQITTKAITTITNFNPREIIMSEEYYKNFEKEQGKEYSFIIKKQK